MVIIDPKGYNCVEDPEGPRKGVADPAVFCGARVFRGRDAD